MQTSDTSRHKQPAALAVALILAAGAASGQDGIDLDDLLDKVGEKIEQYFARAQRVVFLETTTIQYIGSNLSPEGFGRVLESEVRVEAAPADGDSDGSTETKVVRELRRVNGHARRPSDDRNNCLDPNPISPEPLAFLLPEQRSGYEFTRAAYGKGKDRHAIMIDFRELGGGQPIVKERPRDKKSDCIGFQMEFPGRTRGRVWIDASSYEVLRVDERIAGRIDFRLPESKERPVRLDDWQVLERYDMSIRYRLVPFRDPEEVHLLPESIDTVMVVRGMQSYRMKQVFSDYRRFVTDAKLVK
jgi:hypothetical protein